MIFLTGFTNNNLITAYNKYASNILPFISTITSFIIFCVKSPVICSPFANFILIAPVAAKIYPVMAGSPVPIVAFI